MPLSQSEALGRYPLARSQLTLGTRRKNRVEQFKKECGHVNTGQKRVCTTRKKREKVTKKKTKCIYRCEGPTKPRQDILESCKMVNENEM